MASDSTLERMVQAEQAAEAARALAHRREVDRRAGVAWSGLGPDPFRPRSTAALAHAAHARLEALRHWRASPPGRLLAAMAEAERAVEAVRACVARGDAGPTQALADLQSAVDAAHAAALTAGPCATNTASRPPSTA